MLPEASERRSIIIRRFRYAHLLLLATLAAAMAWGDEPQLPYGQDFGEPRFVEGGADSSDFTVHTYVEREQGVLRLFVFSPDDESAEGRAALLMFHSGGWTRGRPEWLFGLARRFAAQGLVAIPVQYRLSGDGVTPVDAFADACAAFRWVRRHGDALGVDPRRVGGWGASAGGQLAAATPGCPEEFPEELESGVSAAADALVLVSGGVDTTQSAQFRRLVGEGVDVSPYSPLALVQRGAPPALLVVGAKDTVTPQTSAETYCERVRAVGSSCELRVWLKLGHLLTRRLDDQRGSVDPDPAAEWDAYREQERFLRQIGFIEPALD